MLNSRCYDLMAMERYVDQSRCSFIHELASQQCHYHTLNCHSSVYEASWSKMVHLRKVSGKCKY